MKGNLMAKSKQYNRRYDDKEMNITMLPSWMDKLMSVCKYFLYIVPFLCCSIAMLVEGTPTSQSYILTAVYCLSLLKLIELADK
jgi:heme O synthase-like polyprenyltransferase|tara:strand:- start:3323 stop:3574 length:252 start_codon:yes stop_codon:yes gene_type:complete